MGSVRKHRDIKLAVTEKKKKLFGVSSKLWYDQAFHRKSVSNRNEKKADTFE